MRSTRRLACLRASSACFAAACGVGGEVAVDVLRSALAGTTSKSKSETYTAGLAVEAAPTCGGLAGVAASFASGIKSAAAKTTAKLSGTKWTVFTSIRLPSSLDTESLRKLCKAASESATENAPELFRGVLAKTQVATTNYRCAGFAAGVVEAAAPPLTG